MEPTLYPGQAPASPAATGPSDQEQNGSQHFPLQNPYGIANQFADVSRLEERNAPEDREPEDDKKPRVKRKRASKACDACRARKVKCDVSRNPCPQCEEHGIQCLFTTPAKKRGPPNAYVEAQKLKMAQQQQREQQGQQQTGTDTQGNPIYNFMESHQSQHLPDGRQYSAQPPVPEHLYHAHSPSFGPPGVERVDLGLEELATPDILNKMFDDFFTFVYPIAPIILESQFRRNLSNPASYTNDFLALCASILATTVVCLRSNAHNYGQATFEACLHFALVRLGLQYRERITVEITATLEYLALSSSFSTQMSPAENTRSGMFRAEATSAVQGLVWTHLTKGRLTFVEQQLLKRSFVHLQYFHSALTLQGRHARIVYDSLSRDDVSAEEMMPLDLTDDEIERISETGDEKAKAAGQFANLLAPTVKSYVPALILLHGLYRLYADSHEVRNNEHMNPVDRFAGMYKTLLAVRHYLDNVPVQLRWEENNKVHGTGFEVQKANLYVARMHLSSVLLEKCHMLESRSPGASGGLDLERERRAVISETLRIIKTISRQALEGNGRAMVKRVRQVASTLTEIIQSQKGSDHSNAQDELNQFVAILSDLDPNDARDPLGQISADLTGKNKQEEGWRRFNNKQIATSG